MNDFAVLMKFLRERSDISARHLSETSGLSLSYISKMEKGTVTPTVSVFAKIIKNLNVTDAEILYILRELGDVE